MKINQVNNYSRVKVINKKGKTGEKVDELLII